MVPEVSPKIVPLEQLRNARGIHCHGCFDLLHLGHIRHLRAAKEFDPALPLIVTLTPDRFVQQAKGAARPFFSLEDRMEAVAALECVDFVAACDDRTGLPAIETIRPLCFVKGMEYQGAGPDHQQEIVMVQQYGGQVRYTPKWMSTSELVARLRQ
jgi:rfaE bifunctional protein nucleotidyltransferase chain/domain